MELIDTITVRHQEHERHVMLYVGDLSSIPQHESVDLLIVSAFPNDYIPTRTSLIGALNRKGISIAQLARDKEVDLRKFSSCWLSRPIEHPDAYFHRVLCFEPQHRGTAPEVVGDVFRSIVPFTAGNHSISQVAMPLLAAGDQGESSEVMLEMLVTASLHWLSLGMPLGQIKIVVRDSSCIHLLHETFGRLKRQFMHGTDDTGNDHFRFDVFISYSQKNRSEVDQLVEHLIDSQPSLRIFLDRLELNSGAAWQQHIFECLDDSRKVICAFSPDYMASKICKEEFNIALFRHRETENGVLLPVYLFTAELPTYMKLLQYQDVREGSSDRIAEVAAQLVKYL
ncbi:toll/interleukin-1 receptor domain-containing protein [Thalassoroseus pseudoceratinae]|uniref:toll/interleukin-1 receptor domain-containing protein n=1 Tax=Thalassoroseus pseudoceratinae TaxID=2713176 RepID=UPI0014248161|nr:toll/interleukin-1 receptor domain-containing protein [Thalassoroseus pseudoceratinae]